MSVISRDARARETYEQRCERDNDRLCSLFKVPEELVFTKDYAYPNSQNMVVTLSVGGSINPRNATRKFLSNEYKPSKFAAMVMRHADDNSKTTVLIFSTGKIVCVGGKTMEEIRLQLQKYRRVLKFLGYKTDFEDMTLHNQVCNGNVGHPVDIAKMNASDPGFTVYNPKIFPGMIKIVILPNGHKIIFLIFDTGAIIAMGLKIYQEAIEATQKIIPVLRKFRTTREELLQAKRARILREKSGESSAESEKPKFKAKTIISQINKTPADKLPELLKSLQEGNLSVLEAIPKNAGKRGKSQHLSGIDDIAELEEIPDVGDILAEVIDTKLDAAADAEEDDSGSDSDSDSGSDDDNNNDDDDNDFLNAIDEHEEEYVFFSNKDPSVVPTPTPKPKPILKRTRTKLLSKRQESPKRETKKEPVGPRRKRVKF